MSKKCGFTDFILETTRKEEHPKSEKSILMESTPYYNKEPVCQINICPVIAHEFRHNIAKVAVGLRGDSGVDPQCLDDLPVPKGWRNS